MQQGMERRREAIYRMVHKNVAFFETNFSTGKIREVYFFSCKITENAS